MNRLNSGKADPLTARDRCRQWAPALRPDGKRGRSGLEGGGPGHCADCPGGGGRAGGPAGRGGAGRGAGLTRRFQVRAGCRCSLAAAPTP